MDPLAFAIDPALIMTAMGKKPDAWQADVLRSNQDMLLNCCRQSGKSTVIGAKVAHKAVFAPGKLSVIVSKSQRQAAETFRKALDAYYAMGQPIGVKNISTLYLELSNGSRIISLPGKEGTIRGYSGVALLIIDEASRVPEDIYTACRPMLAVSKGQLCILSTPWGQRGFFWREWASPLSQFRKIKVSAHDCPRFTKHFLAAEKESMGETAFAQEYLNSFLSVEGLVYPKFGSVFIDEWPYPEGRRIGGIDWGWRNPFAAVWGIHDKNTDILYIQAERYARGVPLFQHVKALKKERACWVADPAGATEITELRAADITCWAGNNDIKCGIAALTARIETGRLKILRSGCPNIAEEAQLYRYPDKREFSPDPEKPIDDHNHALSALRYLISKLDSRFIAKLRKANKEGRSVEAAFPKEKAKPRPTQMPSNIWKRLNDPNIWSPIT